MDVWADDGTFHSPYPASVDHETGEIQFHATTSNGDFVGRYEFKIIVTIWPGVYNDGISSIAFSELLQLTVLPPKEEEEEEDEDEEGDPDEEDDDVE